ncbi:MAG TPA: rhodanese-like domain-containing protein [Bacteroidota bacterium]|nr:rhodanese-like domain-containing protein [Bacteroidota bacterium]
MSALIEKIRSGARIYDVRTPEEFYEEAYPGAVNIPVDQVVSRLSEFGDRATSIVLYCASGARSAFAARLLRNAGYRDVINAGGLSDMPPDPRAGAPHPVSQSDASRA